MTEGFTSVKNMINWLLSNEGVILRDSYGRQWKYANYKFYFKDIGPNAVFEEGIKCLHLYQSI